MKGRQYKDVAKPIWLRDPLPHDGGTWVAHDHFASEWLSLFYDLAVVATLTVFSTVHELDDPSRILPFFSYFVIIYWLWSAQTLYDVSYQSDDILHLFFKFLQICVFVLMGAASGDWSPDALLTAGEQWANPPVNTESERDLISTSFRVVVSAYTASRIVLALQYAICIASGHRLGRKVKHLFVTVLTLLVSTALCFGAIFTPLHSYRLAAAKITLFYLAIGMEVIIFGAQTYLGRHAPALAHHVIERYAALILIILGEGFILLTKVFKRTLSGLSTRDAVTYTQVVMAIGIMSLLWGFQFSRFSKGDQVSYRRQQAWQILQFPLAFALLLFLSGLANTVLTISAANGMITVTDIYTNLLNRGIIDIDSISRREKYDVYRYMDRLDLIPPFRTEIATIDRLYLQENASVNATVELVKYFGQIIYRTLQIYDIEPPEAVTEYYTLLHNVSALQSSDISVMDKRLNNAYELVSEMLNDSLSHLFSGSLWLLPTAGGVLLLMTLRSMIWNRYRGVAHWVIHGAQLVASLVLLLLGLLSRGSKQIHVEGFLDGVEDLSLDTLVPIYDLVALGLPLVIVLVVYFVAYAGSGAVMWLIVWRRERKKP